MPAKKKPLIMWLLPMKRMLYALIPATIASVYFFGWRSLALLITVNVAGFLTEYIFTRHYNEPVNSSVFVTNMLFALTLPPTLPLWMAAVGIVFGVLFGKLVFGGFGKNIFNPALVGRAFIYVTFAGYMTGKWALPSTGLLGGFITWVPDAVTSATVLQTGEGIDRMFFLHALLGNIPGSLGETSALAIMIGGFYLYWKKIANRIIIHWTFIGMVVMQGILWLTGLSGSIGPLSALLSGGFMLGLFFMVTDPVSAPKNGNAQLCYGLFIGVMTSLIRTFSVWPEGMMFAILLGNMFAPITDYFFNEMKKRKKNKAEATA